MAEMAERRKEWQNGRMAEMATYVLFTVHTDDDDDTDDDDTLIFYSIERVCESSLVGRVGVLHNPVPQYRFASGRAGSMDYSPHGAFFAYEFLTASKKHISQHRKRSGLRGSNPACVIIIF
jgi:hypothetical protein